MGPSLARACRASFLVLLMVIIVLVCSLSLFVVLVLLVSSSCVRVCGTRFDRRARQTHILINLVVFFMLVVFILLTPLSSLSCCSHLYQVVV